jgi:hypothetical protein
MPRLLKLALKLALVLGLPLCVAPSQSVTVAGTPSNGADSGGPVGAILSALLSPSSEDEIATLQRSLKATDEEWSIIWPKLVQVMALRAAVYADGPAAESLSRRLTNGPMGGTSMDAPTMAGRSRWSGRTGPFDPASAPGARATSAGLGAALTRGLSRNWANTVKTGQGNSVQMLLTELQALLDDRNTTDRQLFDKLVAIRAARAKAARDLDAAQKELTPLLTTDQLAVLVSLGYMD